MVKLGGLVNFVNSDIDGSVWVINESENIEADRFDVSCKKCDYQWLMEYGVSPNFKIEENLDYEN